MISTPIAGLALSKSRHMGIKMFAIVVAAMALGACAGGGGRSGGDGLPMRSSATAPSLSATDRDQSMLDMQREGAAVRAQGQQLRLNGAN